MVRCLTQSRCRGMILILPEFDMPYFVNSHGRSSPLWMEMKEEWMRGGRRVGGGNERIGGRGNSGWYVK